MILQVGHPLRKPEFDRVLVVRGVVLFESAANGTPFPVRPISVALNQFVRFLVALDPSHILVLHGLVTVE
jgi:hypothetical protein